VPFIVNLRPLNELAKIISARIRQKASISFEEFMRTALYEPGLGYYCSDRRQLGFQGDFFTSCTLSPVFGHTIAAQLREMWLLSGIRDFTVVEYGAGTGELCEAILDYFEGARDVPGHLNYVIIEISPELQTRQKQKLGQRVRWTDQITELTGFEGVVLSNELHDNFPVHRVKMQDGLKEIFVTNGPGGFEEVLVPAGEELVRYFSDLKVTLREGCTAEVCLYAADWMKEVARSLRKGFVFTIDYGYLSGDLYAPSRCQGTIVSYRSHKVVEDLYADPGQQDISAHVNFSALALFGMNNGLQLTGFREQGPFLRALGIEKALAASSASDARHLRQRDTVSQALLGDMGKKFKVLVLQKDLPKLTLSGFRQEQN
jgi:SAM-dependent MidA family methyltransferase